MNGLLLAVGAEPEVVSHRSWDAPALRTATGAKRLAKWGTALPLRPTLALLLVADYEGRPNPAIAACSLAPVEAGGNLLVLRAHGPKYRPAGLSYADLLAVCSQLLVSGAISLTAGAPRQIGAGVGLATPHPPKEGKS